jgi:DNA-binding NarL/FixJ family response regulator
VKESEQRSQSAKGKRILVVDDHPLVRESLKRLIQGGSDLSVCGEAEDREQALIMTATLQPHLVIVDLTLKNSRGTELIRDLHEQHPKVLVLVLSMHDEILYAERAIRAGAHGYITKQEPPGKILAAIHRVLNGEIYWSEKAAVRVASKVARRSSQQNSFYEDILTHREMQVFEMIGTGKNIRQIAALLHIDASTVETYRARIKEKLSFASSSELLQEAIRWSNSPKP